MRKTKANSKIDYHDNDYRAFIFAIHENYGYLLLKTKVKKKKNKGSYWEVPGGHIDKEELKTAGKTFDVSQSMNAANFPL
jgi:8-oxo-dGTP pyrophosphatase MutT (NUDIX family)